MPRLLFSLSIASAVLASVASTACTTHTIVHVPAPETVSFEKSCAKTACEAQSAATSSATSHCSDCISAIEEGCLAGGSCDTSQCDFACNPPAAPSPPACSDDTCLKYTWVAHATGFTATPGVEQACLDGQTRIATRCGFQLSDDATAETEAACASTARYYTEAAVPDAECLDAFDCKTGQRNCERTTTNGDHFCAAREGSCGSPCPGDIREVLNHFTFGMKPALIAALETCASQSSCEDVDACLTAWFNIIE